MKKVLASMSGIIAAVFGIAVLALLMSLTYGALQRLFPGNFANQMWGLTMFDIAAMCWAVIFVFQSKSTLQYAAAGIGFIVAFIGTLGMVAAEVMLSGTTLTPEQTAQIAKWMTYGFIGVTAIHAALVYLHHAGAPEIHEQINVGVARGEIVTEAISQATRELEVEKANLAQTIHQDIVSQVKRDLGLYPVTGTPFEPKRYEQAIPYPAQENATAEDSPLSRLRDWVSKRKQRRANQEQAVEQIAQTNDAMMAWDVMPDGSRSRYWCKVCRDTGAPWLTSEPCEHVKHAKPEAQIPTQEALQTLVKLTEEYIAKREAKTEAPNPPA